MTRNTGRYITAGDFTAITAWAALIAGQLEPAGEHVAGVSGIGRKEE